MAEYLNVNTATLLASVGLAAIAAGSLHYLLADSEDKTPSNPSHSSSYLPSSSSGAYPQGIHNEGNTCYLNSVLQALSSCPEFLEYLQLKGRDENDRSLFSSTLLDVLHRVNSRSKRPSAIRILEFLKYIKFKRGPHAGYGLSAQEDAHEFLVFLVDALETEGQQSLQKSKRLSLGSLVSSTLPSSPSSEKSNGGPHATPFQGLLGTQIHCDKCGFNTALSLQKFTNLSLTPTSTQSSQYAMVFGSDVTESLSSYLKPEVLLDYNCEECSRVNSFLASLGEALAVHPDAFLGIEVDDLWSESKELEEKWIAGNIGENNCEIAPPDEATLDPSLSSSSFKVGEGRLFDSHLETLKLSDKLLQLVDMYHRLHHSSQKSIAFDLASPLFNAIFASSGSNFSMANTKGDSNLTSSNSNLDDMKAAMLRAIRRVEARNSLLPRVCSKRISLVRLPTLLCLHIQRSFYAEGFHNYGNVKHGGKVSFPEFLRLESGVDPLKVPLGGRDTTTYRLVAAICHLGATSSEGHFVTFRRRVRRDGLLDSDTWLGVSDAHVSLVTFAQVCKAEPYLLFYEKLVK